MTRPPTFTVTPWLQDKLHGGLAQGEAVGGTYVFVPEGEQNIKLYGYYVTLKGNLEPTGTGSGSEPVLDLRHRTRCRPHLQDSG